MRRLQALRIGQRGKIVEVDGDMARARELVERCSVFAVLEGNSIGDMVYAASRFIQKTSNKAAVKGVGKVIKK